MPRQLVIMLNEHEGNKLEDSDDGGENLDSWLVPPAPHKGRHHLSYTESTFDTDRDEWQYVYRFGLETSVAFVATEMDRIRNIYGFQIRYRIENVPEPIAEKHSSLLEAFHESINNVNEWTRPGRQETITEALSVGGDKPKPKKEPKHKKPDISGERLLRKLRL